MLNDNVCLPQIVYFTLNSSIGNSYLDYPQPTQVSTRGCGIDIARGWFVGKHFENIDNFIMEEGSKAAAHVDARSKRVLLRSAGYKRHPGLDIPPEAYVPQATDAPPVLDTPQGSGELCGNSFN